MTDTVALFCVLKADAVSGLAPDFLLRVPAQSILLCASLKTNLYLCGLQEILTAANLCVHPSQSHWKWAASQDKHSDGFFFLRLSSSSQNGKTLPCSKEQQKQAEPLMFLLWSFSSSGTQRHGLIFLEISFFFFSSECMWSVWHCAATTKPWAFYHTTTPFLLTLYVSSFTLLRKTKVLKLACWKTSSKAASFWILNKSSDIIL